MVAIRLERTITAPVERVFDWLADPNALTTAPMVLKAGYAGDSPPPGADAVREVIAVGTWFREQITAFDRPRSYSYRTQHAFISEKVAIDCAQVWLGIIDDQFGL